MNQVTCDRLRAWCDEARERSNADFPRFASETNDEMFLSLHHALQQSLSNIQRQPLIDEIKSIIVLIVNKFKPDAEDGCYRFMQHILPSLIYAYLIDTRSLRRDAVFESILLTFYNKIIKVDDELSQQSNHVIRSLTIPNMIPPHNRHEYFGPFPTHDRINAENRYQTLSCVVQNYEMFCEPKNIDSVEQFCRCTNLLLEASLRNGRRVLLDSNFVLYSVNILAWALFNGLENAASEALTNVNKVASFYLWPDVLLTFHAIFNCSEYNQSRPDDVKIGLNYMEVITNYGFKSVKPADDIPLIATADSVDAAAESSALRENKTKDKKHHHHHGAGSSISEKSDAMTPSSVGTISVDEEGGGGSSGHRKLRFSSKQFAHRIKDPLVDKFKRGSKQNVLTAAKQPTLAKPDEGSGGSMHEDSGGENATSDNSI